MKVHEVKIYESYADAVLSCEKNFEIRENDRGYQKGDWLKFTVVSNSGRYVNSAHRLNEKEYEITYVHSGLGMKEGYVALAIVPVGQCRKTILDTRNETVDEILEILSTYELRSVGEEIKVEIKALKQGEQE